MPEHDIGKAPDLVLLLKCRQPVMETLEVSCRACCSEHRISTYTCNIQIPGLGQISLSPFKMVLRALLVVATTTLVSTKGPAC